jgi:periplasmic nitrate reductase NapE
MQATTAEPRKWREAVMFTVLAFLIWPLIAVAFVGAYGLAFWVYFMLAGPPGPH